MDDEFLIDELLLKAVSIWTPDDVRWLKALGLRDSACKMFDWLDGEIAVWEKWGVVSGDAVQRARGKLGELRALLE